jgi:succinyl-CoA synthetase beta subunit
MVNGAGLAMATMDLIKFYGGEPANFLDVGGGANKEQLLGAFKILLSNKSIKSILINIFGGILRTDLLAESLIESIRHLQPQVPIVVRLEGTNVEKARELLQNAQDLKIYYHSSLENAAKKAIELAKT